MSSSSRQLNTCRWHTSPTLSAPEVTPLVPSAMQISRSVTTPHTLPSASTTGRKPQLTFHIISVAAATLVAAWHEQGVPVITAFTCIAILLHQTIRPHSPNLVFPSLRVFANHFHGAFCVQRHRFRHASQHDPVKPAPPMRSHHNQVRLPLFRRKQNRVGGGVFRLGHLARCPWGPPF